jgi:very-short-patch-repair endonuclease
MEFNRFSTVGTDLYTQSMSRGAISQATMKQMLLAMNEWRDRMVSFDGRNRQLFYRNLKTGDVDLSDKSVEITALNALLAGKPSAVSVLYPELFKEMKYEREPGNSSLDDELSEPLELEGPKVVKEWNAKLKKFEAIYRKAKENFDEKNIETCFLADGFVTWELPTSGSMPNAPLVLYPLKVEPNARGNTDFSIKVTGDPIFNQALVIYMASQFGVSESLFEFKQDEHGEISYDIQHVLAGLNEKVKGFKFIKSRLIGNFSFQKYPMVMDLNRIIESGNFHQILAALAGDSATITEINEIGLEETLEKLSSLNPAAENLIFPADSTQHQAISAVLGGKSVVIQGPPGSGKSQTIANLIAESVANRKTVLFVAEKRAAIDAVVNRLEKQGLAGVVLDLHGEPDKKTIAANLLAVIKSHAFAPALSNVATKELVAAKAKLNNRWNWLHENSDIKDFSGDSLTYHQVLRELGDARRVIPGNQLDLIEPTTWKLERLSTEGRDKTSHALETLESLGYFEANKKFDELIGSYPSLQNSAIFESFSEKLEEYLHISESKFWVRILAQTSNLLNEQVVKVSRIHTLIQQIRTYLEMSETIDNKDTEKFVELSICLLRRQEFQSHLQIGFLPAFFKQRKYRKELFALLKKPFMGNDLELYSLITEYSEFFAISHRNDESLVALQFLVDNADIVSEQVNSFSKASNFLKNTLKDSATPLASNLADDLAVLKELREISEQLEKLSPICDSLKVIADHKLAPVLESFLDFEFEDGEITRLWGYAWLSAKLEKEISTKKDLSLNSDILDSSVKAFANLDGQHLSGNSGKILTSLSSRASGIPTDDARTLSQEARKTRAWKPFRKLLQDMPQSIQILKPVMAMSPLAVSQLLPSKPGMFDIVIFDEASQIRPHDAVTAIYRGKQVVIAGDRFQLPPTEFGEKVIEDEYRETEDDEIVEAATFGMESILSSAIAIFNKNVKPLGLHYRSHDEKLISWSNYNIYRKAGEELFTFPSTNTESFDVLRYTYLENVRISGMQDPNYAEIEAVKAAILLHIRETPELTLGVIAFGMRHSVRLQDALNILERENDAFYRWKTKWIDKADQFFVKNIERVQGDERDAIIITPGYAPGLDGVMPLQFGTLNRQGGERRLNVAASRAKDYMHLITSMRSTDIELKRSKSASIGLLKSYLDFMENHGRIAEPEVGFNTATTPFEAEIKDALEARGLTVECQVGDSGFKIDFAIRDQKLNKYVLAIEADGATYHSSEYARERDYMRQRILESRGWKFVRIWSTDWWRDPQSQVRRVLAALEQEQAFQPVTSARFADRSKSENIYTNRADQEEFEIFRGIVAKNPNATDRQLLDMWKSVTGKERETQKVISKFWEYLREARRTLEL